MRQNRALTETFLPFLHWLTRFGSQKHHATRRGASQRCAWSEQLYAREGASLLLQVTIHLASPEKSENVENTNQQNTGGGKKSERAAIAQRHTLLRLRLSQQCSTMKLDRPAAVARQVAANKWQRMTKAYALPLRARRNLIILSCLSLFAYFSARAVKGTKLDVYNKQELAYTKTKSYFLHFFWRLPYFF